MVDRQLDSERGRERGDKEMSLAREAYLQTLLLMVEV